MLLIKRDLQDKSAAQLYSIRGNKKIIWCIFPASHVNNLNLYMMLDEEDQECVRLCLSSIAGMQTIATFHADALTEMKNTETGFELGPDDIKEAPVKLQASMQFQKNFIDQIIEQKIND